MLYSLRLLAESLVILCVLPTVVPSIGIIAMLVAAKEILEWRGQQAMEDARATRHCSMRYALVLSCCTASSDTFIDVGIVAAYLSGWSHGCV